MPHLQRQLTATVSFPAPLVRQNSLLLEPIQEPSSISPKGGGASPKTHQETVQSSQSFKLPSGSTPKGPIGVLPESILVEILTIVLQKPECANGVVIDGLKTTYSGSMEITASSLSQAISNAGKKACFLVLQTDVNTIRSRKSQLFYAEENKVQEQLKQMSSVSETEYDNMTAEDQASYEATRALLKQQRREAQERRKKEIYNFSLSIREQEKAEEEKIMASKKATASVKKRPIKGTTSRTDMSTAVVKRVDSASQNNKSSRKKTQTRSGTDKDLLDQASKEAEALIPEDVYLTQFAEKEMAQFNTNAAVITNFFEEKQTEPEESIKQRVIKTAKLAVIKKNRRKIMSMPSDSDVTEGMDKDEGVVDKKIKTVFSINGNPTQDLVYDEILSLALSGLKSAIDLSTASRQPSANPTPRPEVPEATQLPLEPPGPVFADIPVPRMFELLRKPEVRKVIKPKDLRFSILTPPWKPQPMEE